MTINGITEKYKNNQKLHINTYLFRSTLVYKFVNYIDQKKVLLCLGKEFCLYPAR